MQLYAYYIVIIYYSYIQLCMQLLYTANTQVLQFVATILQLQLDTSYYNTYIANQRSLHTYSYRLQEPVQLIATSTSQYQCTSTIVASYWLPANTNTYVYIYYTLTKATYPLNSCPNPSIILVYVNSSHFWIYNKYHLTKCKSMKSFILDISCLSIAIFSTLFQFSIS